MYFLTVWLLLAASSGYGLPNVKFGSRYVLSETVRMLDDRNNSDSVGFSIRGELSLEYLHANLLQAQIHQLKLLISSRKAPMPLEFVPHASKLDEMENSPFLIELEDGKVNGIFISDKELPPVIKLKKGIVSSMQFQEKSSSVTETDVSGECKTSYNVVSDRILKEKSKCTWPNQSTRSPRKPWGNQIKSLRKTSINLKNNKIVDTINAVEKHSTKARLSSFASLEIETVVKLQLSGADVKKDRLSVSDVKTVIRNTEKELGLKFTHFQLSPDEVIPDTNIMKFADVVDKFSNSLRDSELGTTKSAWALVKSIRSMKNTKAEDLYAVLSSKKYKKIRHQLIDIFGAVQTNATHSAALKMLKLNTKTMDLDMCERYLWALSTSPNIKKHVVEEIYEMVKAAKHPNEKLWETLILTLPAMAYKYNKECHFCDEQLLEDTVTFLNDSINACPPDDETCQMIYLRGLVNIPTSLMKQTLREKALSSKGKTGTLAMRFIERLDPSEWDSEILKAAEQVFLGNLTYDSSARCIAMDILLRSKPNDNLLYRIMSILTQPFSTRELKEYLFQRLDEFSETDIHLKQRIKKIMVDQGYYHYDYIAQGGFSTAFRRPFMDGGALSTTQEVVGGVLKRGNVHVNLAEGDQLEPVFTLGLFTSGLSSFMSSNEEGDESASGGLELNVLGVGLRPFVFFNGHGELMGHVWSGTASSLTPAFQALILLEDDVVKIPLGIGYYASVTTSVGASVDLSGKIEISLWNRNAESLVQNKAGVAFDSRIDLDTTYVKTTAEYNIFSEPELHLTSNIQFSGKIALCLQLQQPTSTLRFNTYRIERIPGSKHKLRKSRYRKISIPGKTYALNSKNNEMCNVILEE